VPGSSEPVQDAYGPTMLACLEYIAHRFGIHPHLGKVWFSLGSGEPYEYSTVFYGHEYAIRSSGKRAEIIVDGKAAGAWDCGIRVVTGETGSLVRILPIEDSRQSAGSPDQREPVC